MSTQQIRNVERENGSGLELVIMLFILALVIFGSLQPSPSRGRTSNLVGETSALNSKLLFDSEV